MRLWAEQDQGEYKLQKDGSLQVKRTLPKSLFSALAGALLRYHVPLLVRKPLFTCLAQSRSVTTDSMQLKATHTNQHSSRSQMSLLFFEVICDPWQQGINLPDYVSEGGLATKNQR